MLVEETDRTKQESEEYISFMSKKTMKRQSLIISLGDKNKHELSEIEKLRRREENEFKGTSNSCNSCICLRFITRNI